MKRIKKEKCCFCLQPLEALHGDIKNAQTGVQLCAVCLIQCLSSMIIGHLFPQDTRIRPKKESDHEAKR